ncbi:DUF5682 family protein [Pseudoalteromonas rubra]|uniref:DUF5682 family protein n=1 Tax=Pseudoalteromonas rubra TaxID=43658 RepID=UPI001109D507|nr:DUF5682 family protein [Pseudoalteromonas rubra]
MDELNAGQWKQELSELFYADERIRWAPIRHHSPACSLYLIELLNTFEPEQVLIEAPANYLQHVDDIASAHTKPPIAIYQQGSFFPLAENSPEYQAIKWAKQTGAEISFIDLPHSQHASGEACWDESWLNSSSYSQQLQQRYQCRDADELWCRLFEQKEFTSADAFFFQVLLFCAASRACFSQAQLVRQGDELREDHMRAHISAAHKKGCKILVLTGGFHTPALFAFDDHRQLNQTPDEPSYLVRYSEPQLDALLGYRAGMPYPGYTKEWFLMRQSKVAHFDLVLTMLERCAPDFMSVADKIKAAEHLQGLLQLRGMNQPSYYDLSDSVASCWLQGEKTTSWFTQLQLEWRGRALGELPEGSVELPLIANVRALAKQHRLSLQYSEAKKARFDVFEPSGSTRNRRQFLFSCCMLGIPFCTRLVGPSFSHGADLSRQHEVWEYQWSPHVEVTLLELSELSDRLDEVVKKTLLMQLPDLDFEGRIEWIANAIQCGLDGLVADNLSACCQALELQTDLKVLISAMIHMLSLAKHPLFAREHDLLRELIEKMWQQLCGQLMQLNALQTREALDILMSLQGLCVTYQLAPDWKVQLQRIVSKQSHKTWLYYTISALMASSSEDIDALGHELTLLYSRDPQVAFDALRAIASLLPHWLDQQPVILTLLNGWLELISDEQFNLILPSLRKMFCRLDSQEIDRIAQRVQGINQWDERLAWQPIGISQDSIDRAAYLQQEMIINLKQQGLSEWLSD